MIRHIAAFVLGGVLVFCLNNALATEHQPTWRDSTMEAARQSVAHADSLMDVLASPLPCEARLLWSQQHLIRLETLLLSVFLQLHPLDSPEYRAVFEAVGQGIPLEEAIRAQMEKP